MGLGLRVRSRSMRLFAPALQKLANSSGLQELLFKFRPRGEVFGKAYSTQVWGSAESHSGRGSELGATESLRLYLPRLLEELHVHTFLDAPCGDWNWMRAVDLSNVEYIGADVVPEVIARNQRRYQSGNVKFIVADLTKDALPPSDLILCRDCWVHLSFQDIANILENFRRSGAKYLLTSNSPHVKENKNKFSGLDWRHLNLCIEPFCFPPPMESIKDHYNDVPFYTSLWRIEDLPVVELRA
jgi:hypothetical protein